MDQIRKSYAIVVGTLVVLSTVFVSAYFVATNDTNDDNHEDDNVNEDIIAEWHFDEEDGQTAFDTSGNNNHGVLGSSDGDDPNDPSWTTGIMGGGLSFDGDDFVEMGAQVSEMVSHHVNFTFEMWFKADVVSNGGILSNYNGGSDHNFQFEMTDDPGVNLYLWNEYDEIEGGYSLDRSIETDWCHVVLTHDGYYKRTIINGHIRGESGSDYDDTKIRHSTATTYIGASGNPLLGNTSYFKGTIDEVTIWSKSFTISEIQERYGRMISGSDESVDLSIANEDITISNPSPSSGEEISITASVNNIGDVNVSCTVSFYLDGMDAEDLIHREYDVYVPVGGTTDVTYDWTVSGGPGGRSIIFEIADSNPAETNLFNNQAYYGFNVTAS